MFSIKSETNMLNRDGLSGFVVSEFWENYKQEEITGVRWVSSETDARSDAGAIYFHTCVKLSTGCPMSAGIRVTIFTHLQVQDHVFCAGVSCAAGARPSASAQVQAKLYYHMCSDVEKCQTEGFVWQNFIRTDKKLIFLLHISLFGLTRFSKSVKNDWHVQKDFNISVCAA